MKQLYFNKTRFLLLVMCTVLGALAPFRVCAQKVLESSQKLRPTWLAHETPQPTNGTFHYQITEGEHSNLEDARHSCLLSLSTYIKRNRSISERAEAKIETDHVDGKHSETESYRFSYTIEGENINIVSCKYDEYWEYVVMPNGSRAYRCYTLYGVADAPNASFDRLDFSRKYGARGFARSLIVPGWGQLYKGNKTKGACILGGEVALIGSIIVAESLRSSYIKKMREQPKHLATYNTKADNWENVRNVCIGGAAALYVYNLIDAVVANGRQRTIVRKPVRFALYPTVGEYNGVALAIGF